MCEKHEPQFNQLVRDWFSQPTGTRLLHAERDLLQQLVQGVFGYTLVQLQDYGHGLDIYAECPFKQRILIDEGAAGGLKPSLRGRSEQLPLAPDSTDLVVLPHSLDFATDPHGVLREVERVLIPEGRVVILGFNPISLWGLWRLVYQWRGDVPWCGHFLSYPRLHDWLGLLGFDVEYTEVCAHGPPLGSLSWAPYHDLLGRGGRRFWPMLAGVYAVRAVKRVSTVRPIKPHWRSFRVMGPGAVEPSLRSAGQPQNLGKL